MRHCLFCIVLEISHIESMCPIKIFSERRGKARLGMLELRKGVKYTGMDKNRSDLLSMACFQD